MQKYIRALNLASVRILAKRWSNQFENPPEFPFFIDPSESGEMLCFCGKPFCITDYIVPTATEIGVDYFGFYNCFGDLYSFHVDWPYNSPIRSLEFRKNGHPMLLCDLTKYNQIQITKE
jgi:hypothetical protein